MKTLLAVSILGAAILAGAVAAQAAPRSYHLDAAKYFEGNGARGTQGLVIQ